MSQPLPDRRFRLIATDLDNTLLRSDRSVSARTRHALDRARESGVPVVPVTARQPIGLTAIAPAAGVTDWVICSNGAYAINLATDEVLYAVELAADTQREIVAGLNSLDGGYRFAVVRDCGRGFVAQPGYPELCVLSDHTRDPATMELAELDELTAEPCLKFVVRHLTQTPAEILTAVESLGLTGFNVTSSGAPFVEISHELVDKAYGLAIWCEHFGIDRSEVVAFGDAANDVSMLRWAGLGVAVANAVPESQAAADVVLPWTNDEDAVARAIEPTCAQMPRKAPAPPDFASESCDS